MEGFMLPAEGPGCQHGHHDKHHCAQNADHLNHNTPIFTVFTEVVCTLGTTPPQTVISPPPNGGNGGIRDPTRRRHTDSQPLMLQNPHRHRYGGHRRVRRAWPRHPWAAGPGWTTSQRADRSEQRGRPKRAGLTPPPAEFRMQFPRSTNQHKLKNRRISTIRTKPRHALTGSACEIAG